MSDPRTPAPGPIDPSEPGPATAEDAARFRRAREIFEQICDEDATTWPTRTRELAGGDTKLAEQVAMLLRAHEENPDFLEQPAQIGPFRIVEKIGEGGMGVVYRAEQPDPQREVALKVLGLRSPELVHRFEFEQRVLALMDHPNVAKVYQTGKTRSGSPYLAMELVEGESVTDYCMRNDLPLTERLRLFVGICRGIEHAHRKGIIHRDIKPSNILVKEQDGRPTPRIIDFGISKLIDQGNEEEGRTRAGQAIGTPAYMAPEQAAGLAVDVSTDVYALGVVLYEMLTHTLPFEDGFSSDMNKAMRPSVAVHDQVKVGSTSPAQGKRMARALRGDLDRIIVKALSKDPEHRFASAREFREDIQRYLNDEPVRARAPSAWYRTRKFVKRNKWGVAGATAVVVLVGLFAFSQIELQSTESDLQREVERVGELSETIVALVREATPDQARSTKVEALTLLDRISQDLLEQLVSHPEYESRLRVRLGDAYRQLGYFERAEQHLLRAFAIVDDIFPGNTRQRLDVLNALGSVYNASNDYAQAVEWYEKARPIAAAVDPSGELEAVILKNLADCYARTDQVDSALDLLENAIAIREQAGDKEQVVVTLTSVGDLERRQGRLTDAIETLSDALALRQELMEPTDPKLAYGYYARAQAYLDAEKYERARSDLREALRIWRRALRPDHPNLAACLEKLAKADYGAGDYISADKRFQEALEIERDIAGDDPRHLIELLTDYASFLADTGRPDRAALFREESSSLSQPPAKK